VCLVGQSNGNRPVVEVWRWRAIRRPEVAVGYSPPTRCAATRSAFLWQTYRTGGLAVRQWLSNRSWNKAAADSGGYAPVARPARSRPAFEPLQTLSGR